MPSQTIEEIVVTGYHSIPTGMSIYSGFNGFTYDYNYAGVATGASWLPLNNMALTNNEEKYTTPEGCKVTVKNVDKLTPKQVGLVRKILAEGGQDPNVKAAFEFCEANNLSIELYFDDIIHKPDGTTAEWSTLSSDYGLGPGPFNGVKLGDTSIPNSTITLTMNSDILDNFGTLAATIVHEILHIKWQSHETLDPMVIPALGNIIGNEMDFMDYFNAGKAIGTDGADTLTGGSGYNDMNGGKGDDILFGGASDDYLEGGFGDDTLHGMAGNDVLVPGPIASSAGDILYGGSGNDSYLLMEPAASRTIDDASGSADSIYLPTDSRVYVHHYEDSNDVAIIGMDTYSVIKIIDGAGDGKIELIELSNGNTGASDTFGFF